MVSTPVLFGDMVWVTGGAHNIRGGVALRLVGSGRDTQIEELWRDTRFAPHSSSPVYHDGLLFTVTDNGILTCFDAATGDVLWNHRLDKRQNRAALLLGDGKLYVGSGSGWMTVVAAAREPQVLAENTLDEPGSNASPAFGDGCLLLRGREQLFCIEAEEESSSPVGET
jgi:outer membrane protein assembly factor BamB